MVQNWICLPRFYSKLDIRCIHSQFYEAFFLVYPSLHWNSAFEITFVIYWSAVPYFWNQLEINCIQRSSFNKFWALFIFIQTILLFFTREILNLHDKIKLEEKFEINIASRLYFIILFHNCFQIIFFTRSIILNLYTIFSKLYYFSFIIFTHSRILNSILTTNSGTILCLFKFITLFIKIYSLHDSFQIIPFSAPLHSSYPVNIQEFLSSSH